MRDYITLNGVRNTTIRGLMVQKLPPITKPPLRFSAEEIDGRDGDIVRKLGYAAYDRQVVIGLYGDYDLDGAIRFFNSSGTVVFSNEPHRYYKYEILGAIDFEKLVRFRQATVTFHCQPFKWSCVEKPIAVSSDCNQICFFSPYADGDDSDENGDWIVTSIGGIGISKRLSVVCSSKTTPAMNSIAKDFIVPLAGDGRVIGSNDADTKYRIGIEIANKTENMSLYPFLIASDDSSYGGHKSSSGTTFFDIELNRGEMKTLSALKLHNGRCRGDGACVIKILITQITDDSLKILNTGNHAAKPDIRIEGTGTVGIKFEGKNSVEVTLPENTPITLKTDEMNAYDDDGLYRNRCVEGDFRDLVLEPGFNNFYIYGNATGVTFDKYSRWI